MLRHAEKHIKIRHALVTVKEQVLSLVLLLKRKEGKSAAQAVFSPYLLFHSALRAASITCVACRNLRSSPQAAHEAAAQPLPLLNVGF